MVDVAKHIEYWRESAKEDWDVAVKLVGGGNTRHGLFFAHLALEKILKGHVCKKTRDIAPKIHSLIRLAEIAGIELDEDRRKILSTMNEFQIEGRYSEMLAPPPDSERARGYMTRAEEVFQWMMRQL